MNSIRNNNGSTLVELVMVMTLMLLFGVTIFTMIYTGSTTQERIINEKDIQMDARIAISYLNVKLRQNDAQGKIAVEKIDLTGSNAIVIRERTNDYEYDTWIFCHNGKLLECLVFPGNQPTELDSFHIVDAENLVTEYNDDEGSITNTLYYKNGETERNITSTVYIRSKS